MAQKLLEHNRIYAGGYKRKIELKKSQIRDNTIDDFSIYRENQEAYKRWLARPMISYNMDKIHNICPMKDIEAAYNEYAESIIY